MGASNLLLAPGTIKPRHAPASASFVLGLQQVATAVLRNFEIVRVNCCSRNACVFPPFENIVYVSVMCGYRPARVRQQSVNQTGSLNCAKQVGFLRIGSVFGCRQIRCPAAGSWVSAESAWPSGISDPAIASSEKSLQVVREPVTMVLTLPTHVLQPHRILYGFCIMIQKQLFRVFKQLTAPEVKHFYQKNTWKNSQIIFI